MALILSFPDQYFIKDTQRPLTKLMIKTLQLACNMQKSNVLFGPKDIKGSVIPLIKRGLISSHLIQQNGKSQLTWFVTQQAIDMIKDIDPKIQR